MTKKNCSTCGQEFDCGALAKTSDCGGEAFACWCSEMPGLKTVNAETDCLCPVCLTNALAESSPLRHGSGESS